MNITNNDPSGIREKVKSYIQQVVHADKDKIGNDSLIFKEGFMDSMGFILMITFIEEEFKIRTIDEDLTEENFESIDTITDFIKRKIQS